MRLFYFVLLIMAISFVSCKSTKVGTVDIDRKAIKEVGKNWELMAAKVFPYQWISYRSKLNIDAPTLKISVRLTTHLIKDSILWASVSKLGIESHRMVLTPDTIKILDRLGNQFIVGSTSQWLQDQGLPLTFDDLQNLWIGSHPRYPQKAVDPVVLNPHYEVGWEEEGLNFMYFYSILENELIKAIITDTSDQSLTVSQSSFNPHEGYALPYDRKYEVEGDEQYTFELSIQDVKVNQPKSLPFQVPGRYERVDL